MTQEFPDMPADDDNYERFDCENVDRGTFQEAFQAYLDCIESQAEETLQEVGGVYASHLTALLTAVLNELKSMFDVLGDLVDMSEDHQMLCFMQRELEFYAALCEEGPGGLPGGGRPGSGGCNMFSVAKIIKDSLERWLRRRASTENSAHVLLFDRLSVLNEILSLLSGC